MKQLLLGTAAWGWTIDRTEAFQLLDTWLAAGHRAIDAATNYPINRNPADFRASQNILAEYIRVHGLHDLRVTMKIGSLDNMRSPEANLSPSFVLMMGEEYRRLLGANLDCLMLHWDNRVDVQAIAGTLESLQTLQQLEGIRPGLSGIAQPEAYLQANAVCGLSFDIQLKNNVLQSDLARYKPLQGLGHRFFAYGINGGGVKLDAQYTAESTLLRRGSQPDKTVETGERLRALLSQWNTHFVRPPIKTMNHIGLIFNYYQPVLHGMLWGPSSVAQLRETLDFYRNLGVFDYGDVYAGIS